MAENQMSGNNTVSGDFLRVLLALKANIMRDLNVADVCQVKQITSDYDITCQSLSDNSSIRAVKLAGIELKTNDVVAVLFTNYDFRSNLDKIRAGQPPQITSSKNAHVKSAAIIIGVVYTEQTTIESE